MSDQEKTAKKYSRASKMYDLMESPIEKLAFNKYRKKAVNLAQGKTLEVGIGTGKNLEYYDKTIELHGIDFSDGMLEKSIQKVNELSLQHVSLYQMDAQNLSFEDNTFDTVISTFVFCTIPDAEKGLQEVYRVLKPGGKAIFLEHMKSKHRIINLFLYMMNVFSKWFLGTSMVRKTQERINKSGLVINQVEYHLIDVVRLIISYKPG